MGRKLGELLIKYRIVVLVVMLLVTVFFLWKVNNQLESYTTFSDLLPQKHPYVVTHNDFRKTFGGANAIAIGVTVKEGDIYNYETLTKIINITDEVMWVPGADRYKVLSIGAQKIKNVRTSATGGIEAPSLMWPTAPKTPEGIKDLKRAIYSNDLYYGTFASIDGKSALITCDFFEEKLDYLAAFEVLQQIRKKYEDSKHIVSIVGTPMILGFVVSALNQTFFIFSITFIAIVIMLWTLFRSLRGVVLPLVAALTSAIWCYGKGMSTN